MNDIIKKIQEKGKQLENEKQTKLNIERNGVLKNVNKIKELAPRIAQLWDICQALLDNGFPLGKTKYHLGFPYYEFETEGIYHGIGFFVNRNIIYGFGIAGGGCSGKSALVNKEGELGHYIDKKFVPTSIDDQTWLSNGDNYAPSPGKLYQDKSLASKLEKIATNFDEFESKVMAYVNKI